MIIERIEIANFRSLKNVDLPCSSLVAILGRNGAGKSTVLHALDMFYNTAAQATVFDYFDRDTSADISIRVTYGDLRPDELMEFAPYITNNVLIVTKVINSGGARYFAASGQLPDFVQIRTMAAGPKRTAFNEIYRRAAVVVGVNAELGPRLR